MLGSIRFRTPFPFAYPKITKLVSACHPLLAHLADFLRADAFSVKIHSGAVELHPEKHFLRMPPLLPFAVMALIAHLGKSNPPLN
jgi:hypothetical protein